jgi:hypothetical protein
MNDKDNNEITVPIDNTIKAQFGEAFALKWQKAMIAQKKIDRKYMITKDGKEIYPSQYFIMQTPDQTYMLRFSEDFPFSTEVREEIETATRGSFK